MVTCLIINQWSHVLNIKTEIYLYLFSLCVYMYEYIVYVCVHVKAYSYHTFQYGSQRKTLECCSSPFYFVYIWVLG